jgi:ubiquinone biosynthesis protein
MSVTANPQNPVPILIESCYAQRIRVLVRGVQLIFIAVVAFIAWSGYVFVEVLRFNTRESDVTGRVLASMLERMGPTFIKLGQVLSSRPDLIGDGVAGQLSRLRAQVNPVPNSAIIKIIEESFGRPIQQLFVDFQPDPLATGSIAQVHLATLKEGQTVAVKVQRPLLKLQMKRDFELLVGVGLVLEHMPGLRNVPFSGLFRELETSILSQLDFEREALNIERFQNNMKRRPQVRIPKLVPELCNRMVITTEHLEDLVPVETLQLSREARRILAKDGLETLYQMIFVDGLVHADLHASNVFFKPNGEIVILDFGLVTDLDNETREQFREFFFAMVTNHGNLCARVILQTAQSFAPAFDGVSYTEAMKAMVDQYSGRRVRDFEVARFATELFVLQRRFGIRGSTAFTMTILSLLVFEGILKTLDPEMDFQRDSSAFMLALPARTLDHDERAAVFASLRDSWNDDQYRLNAYTRTAQ